MHEIVLLIPVSVLLTSPLNRLTYFILIHFFEKKDLGNMISYRMHIFRQLCRWFSNHCFK